MRTYTIVLNTFVIIVVVEFDSDIQATQTSVECVLPTDENTMADHTEQFMLKIDAQLTSENQLTFANNNYSKLRTVRRYSHQFCLVFQDTTV
jgi:hypothetical protein